METKYRDRRRAHRLGTAQHGPDGRGLRERHGRTRKKIFYDVPEQLGELSVQSGFSGSLGLRLGSVRLRKTTRSAFLWSCRIVFVQL